MYKGFKLPLKQLKHRIHYSLKDRYICVLLGFIMFLIWPRHEMRKVTKTKIKVRSCQKVLKTTMQIMGQIVYVKLLKELHLQS